MRSLKANDYSFSYARAGQGEAIVFIHGSLLDQRYWARQVKTLSEKYFVVAPSRRYHWPDTTTQSHLKYTTSLHTTDMIAFIETIGCGPVHLVGHSYGGYLAAQIAFTRPDLLRSLILVEPGGPVETSFAPAIGDTSAISSVFREAAELISCGRTEEGVALFTDTFCDTNPWIDYDKTCRVMTLDNATTLLSQIQEARAPLGATKLKSIACPTLLIGGDSSPSPFPEILNDLQTLIPSAERKIITEASHLVSLDQPSAFNGILDEFILNTQEPVGLGGA